MLNLVTQRKAIYCSGAVVRCGLPLYEGNTWEQKRVTFIVLYMLNIIDVEIRSGRKWLIKSTRLDLAETWLDYDLKASVTWLDPPQDFKDLVDLKYVIEVILCQCHNLQCMTCESQIQVYIHVSMLFDLKKRERQLKIRTSKVKKSINMVKQKVNLWVIRNAMLKSGLYFGPALLLYGADCLNLPPNVCANHNTPQNLLHQIQPIETITFISLLMFFSQHRWDTACHILISDYKSKSSRSDLSFDFSRLDWRWLRWLLGLT